MYILGEGYRRSIETIARGGSFLPPEIVAGKQVNLAEVKLYNLTKLQQAVQTLNVKVTAGNDIYRSALDGLNAEMVKLVSELNDLKIPFEWKGERE